MTGLESLGALLSWLLHATVKGSVVIVLVAALQPLLRGRVDARWRHALWLIVLLRLALPVVPSSSWSIFNLLPATPAAIPAAMVGAAAGGVASAATPSAQPLLRIHGGAMLVTASKWAFAIWLTGVFAFLLRIAIASLLLERAVRRASRRGGDAELQGLVDVAREQLGIRRTVRAIECDFVRTPALHGLVRPTLLLPAKLAESFTRDELRHVVLHELWHQRRLDVAVNWVLSAVQAVHWFNPFVWFATSRIKEERELACDELALSCLEEEERSGYGMTILKLLETFRTAAPVPALVGIVNNKQKMRRRLMMIASYRNRTRFSILFAASLAVIGLVGLTDARGGERHMVKSSLDPAAIGNIERLGKRVSLDLTNVSFAELMGAVANSAGITVTQSPDIAGSPIQQARFTVHADNVPLHAILHESLMTFELAPTPTADGVTIGKAGADGMLMRHAAHSGMKVMTHDEEASTDGKTIEKVMIVRHEEPGDAAIESTDPSGPAEPGQKRITMKVRANADGDAHLSADGKLHREVTLKMDEDGVVSEGKLVLDIQAPPPAN